MTPARIVVVEDDRVVARDIQHQLTRIGHTVVGVTPLGEDAVRLALESHPDLVLMDIRLEGALDGVDAAQQIRNRCQVPVVFLTAYADDETLQRARVTEPFGYLLKPFEDSELRTVIEMALYKHTAERKLRESERRYAVTLASIGDAVIATDDQARVTFLNPVAEALTGWPQVEAIGRPLTEVFHIINEETRQPVENPAAKVLRLGIVVGLANHTVLLARDGREVPIDDCGAPIIDDRGTITGVVLVFRDTTQRRRAEEAEVLRRANARLELALRGSNIGVWENVMPDGDFHAGRIHCSNIMEQLDDPAPESSIDFATMVAPLHPEDRGGLEQAIQAYLAGLTAAFRLEYRVRHRDGSYRWFLSRGIAVRDAGGKPIRFAGTRVDITDLKRIEEALRAGEQRFRTFVDHATDAFFLHDDQLVVVDVNRQACQSLGYTRDELVGMTPLDFDPDVTPALLAEFGRRLDTGEILVFESRHRRKDGSVFPVEVRGRPFREGGRRLTVALARDITERKRLEAVLRESEAWFRFMANRMPQIVWTARPDGSPEYLNDRYVEYTGLPLGEVTGQRWLATLHPDDRERTMTRWMTDVANGSDHDTEWRLRAADGRYRWFKARGLPVRDESGQVIRWLGTITDIDDQKRAEEALRGAKEAAEAASRAKDEFLANVSHEIRTPMNAILGMTELALDTPLTSEQREYLAIVKSSADALLKVINDLLDFAKIEAGKLELDHADFALRRVLGETLRALALRAHRKGLELACQIQPEVPDALIGDAGRLRQILLNLVGNAIKFTDQGEVVVRVEAGLAHSPTEPDPSVPGSHQSQVLHFSISDTGIGIPRDKQEKIFQAFEQGDNSTTRRYEGTGLGLSIAVRLVALMGGQITVESQPGRGSTFRFTAEFGLQPHPPSGPHERPLVDLHGLRVLVVDDNATNRHILEEWLRGWHTEPLAVADGFGALEALWRGVATGRPFALVLLDVRMPGTDGLAVAESIRRNPELATSRIILLTSEVLHGDIARYRELGIAAYAMKPVPQDELLEIIYRVLSRPDSADAAVDRMDLIAPAVSTPLTPAASPRRLRILVAEDNPFNQRLVAHLLSQKGHDVRVASDGLEALAALELDRFDLMLLDVHMPGCDGFQVIEALRQREQATGAHLPVIALTARATKSDRDRCLTAGMDDYLAKPVGAVDLFAAIERLVSAQGAPRPIPSQARDTTALINPAVLLAACGDDADGLRRMCEGFRDYVPSQLAEAGGALRAQDAQRLCEAAHKLSGLLSTISTVAGDMASKLEDQAACGRLEECRPLMEELEAIARELFQQVDGLSIETLRQQAMSADDHDRTASP